MSTKTMKLLVALALGGILCLPGMAFATTAIGACDTSGDWSQEFMNDYANANTIYLWMEAASPQTIFTGASYGGGHSSWQTSELSNMTLTMYGPEVAAKTTGIFVNFSDPSDQAMSFQWAEVEWVGSTKTVLGTGSLLWDGRGWTATTDFGHATDINSPVPLPGTLLLLGVGMARLRMAYKRRQQLAVA